MAQTNLTLGIIGCGNIAQTYLRNADLFSGLRIEACADLNISRASDMAVEFGIHAMTVDELLSTNNVDLIINLTNPASHFDVCMLCLQAGKHVYTEKPLATSFLEGKKLVEEAQSRGLFIGSAPDTFLGAAGRRARKLMDADAIGRPVTGTAFMLGHGMEHVHPDPQFYYQAGAGPLFDMGPYYLSMLVNLLGPVSRVVGMSVIGENERQITADGPKKNSTFTVGIETTVLSVLQFKNGTIVSFGTSWDVYRHSNHPIELHGTKGSMRLPDPDTFGGDVSLSYRGSAWEHFQSEDQLFGKMNWPIDKPTIANYRMLAVADIAHCLNDSIKPICSAEHALHVLETMEAIASATQSGCAITLQTSTSQPRALTDDQAARLINQSDSHEPDPILPA